MSNEFAANDYGMPLGIRSEEKRRSMVQAAESLFLENGFGATSMDAIALRAGVSKRTVYSHFENKEILFAAVMKGVCLRVSGKPVLTDDSCEAGMLDQIMDMTVGDVLTAVGERFLKIVTSRDSIRLFCVVLSEAARFPEIGETFYRTGPAPLVERLTLFLQRKIDNGTIAMDDPEQAAWSFIGAVKEPWHLKACLAQGTAPSENERKAHVAAVVGAFLKAHSVKQDAIQ